MLPPTVPWPSGRLFFVSVHRKPKRESMKSVYLCLMFLCAVALAGCAEEKSSLAEEDITADDIAKYEEELAAISGDDAYEEGMDEGE